MRETVKQVTQTQTRNKFEQMIHDALYVDGASAQVISADDNNIKLFTNGLNEFHLFLKAGTETIPTFNITVDFYRNGEPIAASDTVTIPAITVASGVNRVDMALDADKVKYSEYLILSYTLPAPTTTEYYISMLLMKLSLNTSNVFSFGSSGELVVTENDPIEGKLLWSTHYNASSLGTATGNIQTDWISMLNFKKLHAFFSFTKGTGTPSTLAVKAQLKTSSGDIYDISEDYLRDASGLAFSATGKNQIIDTAAVAGGAYEIRFDLTFVDANNDQALKIEIKRDTI